MRRRVVPPSSPTAACTAAASSGRLSAGIRAESVAARARLPSPSHSSITSGCPMEPETEPCTGTALLAASGRES